MWLAVTHELEAPDTANKAHVWEGRMRRVAAPGFPVFGDGWSSLAAPDARAQVSLSCCSRLWACGTGLAAGWCCHSSSVLAQGLGETSPGSQEPLKGKHRDGQDLCPSAPPVGWHTSSPLLMISITKGQRAQIWAKNPPPPKAGCGLILVISMSRELPVWH